MPISIANKPQLTGIFILAIGVALLAFTFINAFLFLQEPLSILATGDLGRVFGEALAPLIQACIRLMYLGIMGWIGSMLTVRGIPLVTHRHIPVASAQTQTKLIQQEHTQPQPQVATQPKAPIATVEQPTQVPQQPRTEPPQHPQPPKAQPAQPTPQPEQEEPKAILIPPENQREE
jgi:predicted lipid-binding transport protein (Tim44 family)